MKPVFLKKLGVLILAAFAFCGLSSCQSQVADDGTYKVRIPLDDGSGNYGLQTVSLRTVTDIHAMAGTTAVFQADGHIDVEVDSQGKGMSVTTSYGTTPSAQFVTVDGVLIPSDFESLSLATAMYHFESIKNFYDLFNANRGLKFPRLVLFNIAEVQTRDGHQAYAQNNAAYSPGSDLFLVNPYKREDIPLAMNGGVLAHEYLHSIFAAIFHDSIQQNIKLGRITAAEAKEDEKLLHFSQLDEWGGSINTSSQRLQAGQAVEMPPAEAVTPTANDIKITNNFIWSAINEGIADYYGYEYTRNPGWILKSLPEQSFRDLSSDKYLNLSSGDVQQLLQHSLALKDSRQRLDEHFIGAYFSHFLYLVSVALGSEATRLKTLVFMQRYHDTFILNHTKHFLGMGDLARIYFSGEKMPLDLCRQTQRLFAGDLNDNTMRCDAVITWPHFESSPSATAVPTLPPTAPLVSVAAPTSPSALKSSGVAP